MKVLYFGTYDRDYVHNQIMMAGLRAAGVEVVECHAPLWPDTESKVAAANRANWLGLAWRTARVYARLLRAYWPLRHSYDVMVLGYTGHFDVFPARLLTWLAGKPLVLDILMSLYLIAYERGLAAQHLLRVMEWFAYRLPDLLLLDTPEQAAWFEQAFGVARTRFHLVPLGADNRFFYPRPARPPDGQFRVLYYGTFIPLHGVEYILQAAQILRDQPDIRFELIGRGPVRAEAEVLAAELQLESVTFVDWVAPENIPDYVARADVVLGVFGTTDQSKTTIQNKIYQGMAMGRPVITGETTSVRAVMNHGEHVYLVERANPRALAEAILALRADRVLWTRLSEAGRRLYAEQFTVEAIGQKAWAHLSRLVK